MLAVCTASHLNSGLVGHLNMQPHRHPPLTSPYTSQPWDLSNHQHNYAQFANPQYSLAYRPRVDSHGFAPQHNYMASPTSGMEPPQQMPTKTEYPDDPSFEAETDGRLEMGQDEIDAIIRNKRKVRDPKACYACHRRKVKCNRELPCDSCVKRDHPELCSYERPTKRRRIALSTQLPAQDGDEIKSPAAQSGPNVTVPKEQWERINSELQQLREQFNDSQPEPADEPVDPGYQERNVGNVSRSSEDAEREGIYAPSNQMGTMHLGSRSVLAYMMGLGRSKSTQDAARSLLEENILPKLGLDNESVTYPFVDLWSTDTSIKDINGLCSAIPDDNLCREYVNTSRFGCYC